MYKFNIFVALNIIISSYVAGTTMVRKYCSECNGTFPNLRDDPGVCEKCEAQSYRYGCSKCTYTSHDRYRAHRHTERKHNAPKRNFKCVKCSRTYRNVTTFIHHRHNVCGMGKLKCPHCSFETRYRYSMTAHVKRKTCLNN